MTDLTDNFPQTKQRLVRDSYGGQCGNAIQIGARNVTTHLIFFSLLFRAVVLIIVSAMLHHQKVNLI